MSTDPLKITTSIIHFEETFYREMDFCESLPFITKINFFQQKHLFKALQTTFRKPYQHRSIVLGLHFDATLLFVKNYLGGFVLSLSFKAVFFFIIKVLTRSVMFKSSEYFQIPVYFSTYTISRLLLQLEHNLRPIVFWTSYWGANMP